MCPFLKTWTATPQKGLVCSVLGLAYSFLLSSSKLVVLFLIPPLPPFLCEPLQTAGSPLSTGITPLHRYYGPLQLPLVFHRFPGVSGYTIFCSADFSS